MKLIIVKRFVRTSMSEVKVVVFRVQWEWENMYVVSSPEYFNTPHLPHFLNFAHRGVLR